MNFTVPKEYIALHLWRCICVFPGAYAADWKNLHCEYKSSTQVQFKFVSIFLTIMYHLHSFTFITTDKHKLGLNFTLYVTITLSVRLGDFFERFLREK